MKKILDAIIWVAFGLVLMAVLMSLYSLVIVGAGCLTQ